MSKDYTQQNRDQAGQMFDTLEVLHCHPRMTSASECNAHCPFHDDETPSFSLNMERGVFYCHACGAKGTFWDFNALLRRENYCNLRVKTKEPPMKREDKKKRKSLFRIVDKYNTSPTPLTTDREEVFRCTEDILDYWHGYLMESSRDARLMVTEKHEEAFTRSYFHWLSRQSKTVTHSYISPRFSIETVKRFRIGYAPASSIELTKMLREQYSQDVIIGTGLIRKHGGSGLIAPYSGRIVYPYLKDGYKPVYSIARMTPHTPNNLADCKYLKQRTRDRNHVFPFQNPPLFNESAIHHSDHVLITEGITDAIKACEAGIPAVSPVTIFFKNQYLDLIAHMLQRKAVIICNDNERSGAGARGMAIMASELSKRGVSVHCATLPIRHDQDKVDVCSFINGQGADMFHKLLEEQTGISFLG